MERVGFRDSSNIGMVNILYEVGFIRRPGAPKRDYTGEAGWSCEHEGYRVCIHLRVGRLKGSLHIYIFPPASH